MRGVNSGAIYCLIVNKNRICGLYHKNTACPCCFGWIERNVQAFYIILEYCIGPKYRTARIKKVLINKSRINRYPDLRRNFNKCVWRPGYYVEYFYRIVRPGIKCKGTYKIITNTPFGGIIISCGTAIVLLIQRVNINPIG